MILVTGATGRVGYRLMEALADARADATAMVRVEAKAADLPGTGRHVVGTLDDPPPAQVLRRFDRIFLLSPEIEEQVELERAFIDAVAKAGHRPHIVKLCADGFQDPGCDVRFMLAHRQVAYHLDSVGLPVTYLAAATYMDDLLGEAEEIQRTGEIRASAGQRPGRLHRRHRRRPSRRPCSHHRRPRRRHVRADRAGSAQLRRHRPPVLSRLRPQGGLRRPAGGADPRPAA